MERAWPFVYPRTIQGRLAVLTKTMLEEATKIDFTGEVPGFKAVDRFNQEVISLLRKPATRKVLVVVDRGYGLPTGAPHVVRDHLNLTGGNPLVGPNDPGGQRFPAVNDIYISLSGAASAVAAGIKPGVQPTDEELNRIHWLGADFYCYNLVPTMIVAAHAGWKVLAVAVPEGADAAGFIQSVVS